MTEKKTLCCVYAVYADYRPNRKGNAYYVIANSRREAKIKFKAKISWLDIRAVEQLTVEKAKIILAEPSKHIVF